MALRHVQERSHMLRTEIDLYPKADQKHLVIAAQFNRKTKLFKLSAREWGQQKVLMEDFQRGRRLQDPNLKIAIQVGQYALKLKAFKAAGHDGFNFLVNDADFMSYELYIGAEETEEAKIHERNRLTATLFRVNQTDILLRDQIIEAREEWFRERLNNALQGAAVTSIEIHGLKCSQPIFTFLIDNLVQRVAMGLDDQPLLRHLCLKKLPQDVSLPFEIVD